MGSFPCQGTDGLGGRSPTASQGSQATCDQSLYCEVCPADLLNSRGESDEVLKWNEDMQRWEKVWKSSHTASIPHAFEKVFSPLTKGALRSLPDGPPVQTLP